MKKSVFYLVFILLLFVGGLHTFRVAWDLAHCWACSAPWTVALYLPGLLYVAGLVLLSFLFVLFQKKIRIGILLLFFFFGVLAFPFVEEGIKLQDFLSSSSAVSEQQERNSIIENYLEEKENQQLHYPHFQEHYFCAYEEFDAKKEGNHIISYGRQLCESFFIQDELITCPEDEEIQKACF